MEQRQSLDLTSAASQLNSLERTAESNLRSENLAQPQVWEHLANGNQQSFQTNRLQPDTNWDIENKDYSHYTSNEIDFFLTDEYMEREPFNLDDIVNEL